jgi:hypothetical protein
MKKAKPQHGSQKTKYQAAKPTIRFKVELSASKSAGKVGSKTGFWSLAIQKNAVKDATTIEGTINGLPFQATTSRGSEGDLSLKVTKDMHDMARMVAGELVAVEITRIGEEIETRVPVELTKALATAPKAKTLWEDITPIARRDWIYWIITGRLEETRTKRATTAISKMNLGMRRVCCFPGITWLVKVAKENQKKKWTNKTSK